MWGPNHVLPKEALRDMTVYKGILWPWASALVGFLNPQGDKDRGDKWGPFVQPQCRGSPGEHGSLTPVRAAE